ncbi:DUF6412 domain-containing protein [Actinomadura scrupuli]|uniref:DUF6412 domain-containing protein n=1 Tax=Actinomadura scrupuli TaxID=559629 RepID=UPI003D95BD97
MFWPLIAAMSRVLGVAGVLTEALSAPGAVLVLTAAAVAGLGLLVVRRALTARHGDDPSSVRLGALTLQRRASRAAYVRLRDPGAGGRPRPRAPSAVPRAA